MRCPYGSEIGFFTSASLPLSLPPSMPPKTMGEWDHIRDEVGRAIGDEGHDRRLTIAFTGNVAWAE